MARERSGNLTAINYSTSPDVSYGYDPLNRLTNMVDAVGTTRYSYTSFGAVASEDGPWDTDTVSYSYANQLRTGLTLQRPSASPLALTYAYDLGKRLTSITTPAGAFGYEYDPTRKLHVSKLTFPNGSYISNSFDSLAQITGTFLKNSSHAVLNSHQYTYDGSDYQQVNRHTRPGGDYVDYGYDGIGQLTSALGKESGGTTNRLNEHFRYSYDSAGNLRSRTNHLFEQWWNVNELDQIISIARSNKLTVVGTTSSAATNVTVNTSNTVRYADNSFASTNHTLVDGNNTFTAIAYDNYGRTHNNSVSLSLPVETAVEYDNNGNMTYDSTRGYGYDDENQLNAIETYQGWRSEFVYDGKMRRRVRREYKWQSSAWVLTNEVRYIYDGNIVIQERDGLNAPVVTYTRGKDLSGSFEGAGGIGGLLARTDDRAGTTAFYHADRLGNVTMLINAQQIPVAKYLYDPFGNTLSSSGPLADANLYRFSSKETHANSGLSYYLYRFYSPNLQRWINRDPIGEFGGINLYVHVENQAVNFVDAFGEQLRLPPRFPIQKPVPRPIPQNPKPVPPKAQPKPPRPVPIPIPVPKRPKPGEAICGKDQDCTYLDELPDFCIYKCDSPVGPYIGVTRKKHPNSPCDGTTSSDDVIPFPDD